MATATLSSLGVRSLDAHYSRLGMLLIAPAVLLLLATIIYPLGYALWLSLNSVYTPTQHSSFVGLANYRDMLGSSTFWFSLWITIVWTTSTLVLQVLCGVGMALLLNEKIVFRSAARSLILFPYFVSTVVAVLVWRWLFNDLYGVLNQVLLTTHIVDSPVNWLGQMPNAMISIVLVGTWKYFPFVVIAVLARLQTIPLALYEAARMDGAGPFGRFFDVTLPQLKEVLGVVILLRIIWDFKEFDLLYLMTGGGPVNETRSVPLLVYQQAFGLNQMGAASTSAVGMMVVMAVFMALYLYRAQRVRGHDASR
jgi:multiple sugar transport system permease protein